MNIEYDTLAVTTTLFGGLLAIYHGGHLEVCHLEVCLRGSNKDLCGALESNVIRVFIQSFFAAAGRPPGSINLPRRQTSRCKLPDVPMTRFWMPVLGALG